MESSKNKFILAVISALLSIYIFWLAWGADEFNLGRAVFSSVLGVGFALSVLAVLLGAKSQLLNKATMLLVGVPSLILLALFVWFLVDGTWDFTLSKAAGVFAYAYGVYIAGALASHSEQQEAS
ncbi:hypothetical protein [Aliikangiella maris]|uniref:Uncharacterized protein n=2 Tax=Aliikangiella maris TaxID=3162458 RepID=A0ABV2BPD6_9GAMM